jgi:hypothetical protein
MLENLQPRNSHLKGFSDLQAAIKLADKDSRVTVWGQDEQRAFGGPVVSSNDEGVTIHCRTGDHYTLRNQKNCFLQFEIEPSQTVSRTRADI